LIAVVSDRGERGSVRRPSPILGGSSVRRPSPIGEDRKVRFDIEHMFVYNYEQVGGGEVP